MAAKLKIWTQQTVDAFISTEKTKRAQSEYIDDKPIRMPRGHYDGISFLSANGLQFNCHSKFESCAFSANCRFSKPYKFYDCKFGYGCRFAANSQFTGQCSFDKSCVFGPECNLGTGSEVGAYAHFSSKCVIGEDSYIGRNCRFVECTIQHECEIENQCRFEATTFGRGITFGQRLLFDENCIFEEIYLAADSHPIICIGPLGTERRTTTFFNCTDGIWVRTGCFFGSLADFRSEVKAKREYLPLILKEYLEAAAFVEAQFLERRKARQTESTDE